MGKFNKGDRVKALVNGIDYKIGDEFVLTADGSGTRVYFVDNVGDRRMRPQEEFELLPVAASAEDKPAFKVGDRVRLIKDGQSTTGAVGKLATIESWGDELIDNGQYLLNIDGPVDYQTHAVTPNYTHASPDCFELAPATLTIEAGKFYRTRDGRKVGPMAGGGMRSFPWLGNNASDGLQSYRSDGTWALDLNEPCCHDIIAEWVDQPVAQDTNDDTLPVAEQLEARRFKVGDKVRSRVDYCWVRSGAEYIVNSLDSEGDAWLKNVDGDLAYMTDDELELITPVEEAQKPSLNNGGLTMKISLDATEITEAIKSTLLRTKQGYGFEIARHGDYVWVDTGKKAPIVLKAADVQAAA